MPRSDTETLETKMDVTRRALLKSSAAIGVFAVAAVAGLLRPIMAFAASDWNQNAFAAKSLDGVVKALGDTTAVESSDISLTVPEIAENGAVVPVVVESKLPKTRSISILVEKNPSALSADFEIPEGTDNKSL